MAPSNELKQILDEIEERAKKAIEWPPEAPDCDCPLCISVQDNPKLVKALCLAMDAVNHSRVNGVSHERADTAFANITAILNQGREDNKPDLGEKGGQP